MNWTPELLQEFETDIEQLFASGQIKAPVHLAGGNERPLIEIFKGINRDDWVLCTWRSHYHCLLRGVPPQEVKDAIVAGHSIALSFPDYRILSSALVGGICPIAVGLAWAIKARGGKEKVHVFIGDMTAMTGIYSECWHYASGHGLPVHWIVEDNYKSVMTDTREVWGIAGPEAQLPNIEMYHYRMTKAHVGIGKFVSF